ncbi:MAG TPA: hypothetical protein VFY17_01435 [Pilimelia sp.]|nr:hypothetical protein [Pilimelia sp.]
MAAAALAALAAAPAPAHAVNPVHGKVVGANPVDWTPDVLDGSVDQIVQMGDRIYLGGTFTRVRNPRKGRTVVRPYLVAVHARTGVVDEAFNARLDRPVRALLASPDGKALYAGGEFRTAGGRATRALALLDARTGAAARGFAAPALDGIVYDLRRAGSRLLVGGSFTKVGRTARPALAAVNIRSGAVDNSLHLQIAGPRVSRTGQRAPVKVQAIDVTPDGKRAVVVGGFGMAAGRSRPQLAVLDLGTTVTLSAWHTARYAPYCATSIPAYLRDVDISADGRYFVVVTSGGPGRGTLCDTAARFDFGRAAADKQPTWVNYTGGDTLLSVAVTGAAVYVGGHQRWLDNPAGNNTQGPGAVRREGIGAVHPQTGRALPWNPGKERGVGTSELYATKSGLWIGSDTARVAGERRERVAFFPL